MSNCDAFLRVTDETAGNGVESVRTYDPPTGNLLQITAGADDGVANLTYAWDTVGNLSSRTDTLQGYAEYFCYDGINRLTSYAVTYDNDNGNACTSGDIVKSVAYDNDGIGDGNITGKSDLGVYAYGQNGAGPHAVTSINTAAGANGGCTLSSCSFEGISNPGMYGACPPAALCADRGNANGNMLCVTTKSSCGQTAARSYSWTSFNMAASVATGSSVATLGYSPEHSRAVLASGNITLYYFSNPSAGMANEMVAGATPTWRTYFTADDGRTVAERFATGGSATTYYFVGDHLASTTALTNSTQIEPPAEYDSGACPPAALCADRGDAWGKRRNPGGSDEPGCLGLHPAAATLRGYTGQEMMDTYCLVNLNARLYDPALGRMLSADSMVPDATNGQAYNRYSYVLNNPLAMTDPSGHENIDINAPIVCYECDGFGMPCWGCSGPGVWGVANSGAVISAAYAGWAFNNPGSFVGELLAAGYNLNVLGATGNSPGSSVHVGVYGIAQALGLAAPAPPDPILFIGGIAQDPDSDPVRTSPGGTTYNYIGFLTPAQLSVIDEIVDFGAANTYSDELIVAAVDQAFYESSLGEIESNPSNPNVVGLFQYSQSTWAQYHSDLDITVDADQIIAMYEDLSRWEPTYDYDVDSGYLSFDYTFEDYAETMHHAGENSTAWYRYTQDYDGKTGTLNFGMGN